MQTKDVAMQTKDVAMQTKDVAMQTVAMYTTLLCKGWSFYANDIATRTMPLRK